MDTHNVKSWKYLYEEILSGSKLHEIRKMTDRDYKVGDILNLQEYDQQKGTYTGREQKVEITYITSSVTSFALSGVGLHPDLCILSIKKI